MNVRKMAEIIAEFLIDNKDMVIAMIKEHDKEMLQEEIYDELTLE